MRLDSLPAACRIIVLTLALCLTGAVAASAQDDIQVQEVDGTAPKPAAAAPMSKPTPPPEKEIPQSLPPEAGLDSSEITVLRDNYAGKYNDSKIDNLARLYWRLGAFDLQDNEAIGNYIKITDCEVYTDYVHDDMEWTEILNKMRDHLKAKKDTFPLNFQFVVELHLGRYDPEHGGFPVTDKTGFKDAKRIEVESMDSTKEVCFDNNAIKDYPKGIFLLLPKPFTLDFVKMDEHVAQAYILRKKQEYSRLDESVRVSRYERDAYLRLRVTFNQYDGNLKASDGTLMAILYGNIDGYDIFEDATQKRVMVSVDLKDQPAATEAPAATPVQQAPAPTSMMSLPTQSWPVDNHPHQIEPSSGSVIPVGQAFTQ